MKKSTVIKIPKGYNFKPIPGFDNYLIDTDKMVVFNMPYRKLRSIEGKRSIILITNHHPKRQCRASIPRLIYASKMQIDYYSIPENFIIHNDGGKMVVFVKRDQLQWAHRARIKKAETERLAIIDEKIKELCICRNCYETGDITEAMKFIEEHSPLIMARFKKRFEVSKDKCYIAYEEAFNIMAEKMRSPSTLVLNLSENVYKIMTAQHRKHYRNK